MTNRWLFPNRIGAVEAARLGPQRRPGGCNVAPPAKIGDLRTINSAPLADGGRYAAHRTGAGGQGI
jgi:hypothetical protein